MADGGSIVVLIDRDGLGHWIARWAAAHDSFNVALRGGTSGASSPDAIEAPVFPEVPAAAMLILRPQGSDPGTERSRQQLFLTAVIIVLALTIITGYLAARDISRELRTAALRSTFVAGVTHELKTPLASIRLLAETLRQGRARPAVRDELLDTIMEEADRLARLVDNVLSSSRMESGTRAFSPQTVSLPDAVREAIRRFDYVLRKEGFTLNQAIGNDAVLVRVDPDALGQAVLNLLGNAVKYSGAARAIHVAVEHGEGRAAVRVADEGLGIDAEDRERIFESFYRAPRTAAETTGAGLGLALVRHFAEAHGGRVSVDSHPGRGSVFSIVLPLANTAHDACAHPAQLEESVPDTGHG
jgi:signal transduction histidine kinase